MYRALQLHLTLAEVLLVSTGNLWPSFRRRLIVCMKKKLRNTEVALEFYWFANLVDRRVNYGTEARARTASSDAASPLKASWLSLVNASGFAEAASQLETSSSNRMWFTLLPNRLIAYASPSSSTVLFELEMRKATVKSYDGEKNKYACFIINSAEKSLTIGALTEKIRRNWIDTLEDAINAKGSRSSSISSSSDQPGADITNLPPKNPPPPSSTRGSSSSITSSSSVATSVLSSAAFSDQNRVPPVFSEITPTAIVRPQEVTKPTSAVEPEITDPLALKVTSRDSPPLRRRRNRDRRDRSKTLDPAEISQIIRRRNVCSNSFEFYTLFFAYLVEIVIADINYHFVVIRKVLTSAL